MFKPMVIPKSSDQQDPEPLRIENFGGVDYSTTPTQIAINRSPDMLNMTLDELGKPDKRTGYDKAYINSLGKGQINGLFQFKKKDGTSAVLVAHNTKLYKIIDL